MHEFTFSATSVGRLALSLHQAIRGHRVALPYDETLLEELVAVRHSQVIRRFKGGKETWSAAEIRGEP